MKLTKEQLKGRLKSIAARNQADARVLLRTFMMERFLERLSISEYSNALILKGGILITSLLGVQHRSTMDIDASITGYSLNCEETERIVRQIIAVDIDDGVAFQIEGMKNIMDEMEYPGIRISLKGCLDQIKCPLKLDISAGDIITPEAIAFEYPLLLENRSIQLMSYNLETVLAEKLQTVLARAAMNTRMRDYYDIKMLTDIFAEKINWKVLKYAFASTVRKRNSQQLIKAGDQIVAAVRQDKEMQKRWAIYQEKYSYAKPIAFADVIISVSELLRKCR